MWSSRVRSSCNASGFRLETYGETRQSFSAIGRNGALLEAGDPKRSDHAQDRSSDGIPPLGTVPSFQGGYLFASVAAWSKTRSKRTQDRPGKNRGQIDP